MNIEIKAIYDAILEGEIEVAEDKANDALASGIKPLSIAQEGCIKAIENVGALFEKGDYFLPQLIASAEAMKAAMSIVEPHFDIDEKTESLGRVLIGTVAKDIHDIGKNMVATMLQASGFEVVDLGVDVSSENFVKNCKELQPQVIGLSALLTTTMPYQEEVIKLLKQAGLRDDVKVIVGGAPVSKGWAKDIGADAFAEDAVRAVGEIKSLLAKTS